MKRLFQNLVVGLVIATAWMTLGLAPAHAQNRAIMIDRTPLQATLGSCVATSGETVPCYILTLAPGAALDVGAGGDPAAQTAQGSLEQCRATVANPTATEGSRQPLSCDLLDRQRFIQQCDYSSAPTTITNGGSGNCQIDSRQNLKVALFAPDGITGVRAESAANAQAGSNGLVVNAHNQCNNGSTWDMMSTVQVATDTGRCGFGMMPVSTAAGAASQCFLQAASTVQCGTAAAKNLYLVEVANATADTWISVYNATSAPTNGAQTFGTGTGQVQACFKAPTGTSSSRGGLPLPINLTVGAYIAQSSTACGTLTLATTAIVIGQYK